MSISLGVVAGGLMYFKYNNRITQGIEAVRIIGVNGFRFYLGRKNWNELPETPKYITDCIANPFMVDSSMVVENVGSLIKLFTNHDPSAILRQIGLVVENWITKAPPNEIARGERLIQYNTKPMYHNFLKLNNDSSYACILACVSQAKCNPTTTVNTNIEPDTQTASGPKTREAESFAY